MEELRERYFSRALPLARDRFRVRCEAAAASGYAPVLGRDGSWVTRSGPVGVMVRV
jgi:hypothetical protein